MKKLVSFCLALSILSPGGTAFAQPKIPGFSMSQHENLYWPRLTRGQRGEKVRVLQRLLNLEGAHLKTEGRFDAATFGAVRRFQKARKIAVDGVVGAQTWEKLVPSLQRGSRGEAVRIFQSLLSRNGFPVKQDGTFGAATEKAVRNYQKKEGEDVMIPDGNGKVWVWCWLLGGTNITD